MKRINFSYPALVLIITGFVVSLTGCGQKRELDPRTEPELVRIVEVGSSSGADPAFTGVVSARVQSNLGFRVPGKITSRLVDTGQFVRAGQPLMTIDRTDYVHAITARAETVAAAKAKALQTAADEVRYRGLVKTGAVSASIYDQIKAASDAAQADLAAATAQEQVARDEGGYSQLLADADGIVDRDLGRARTSGNGRANGCEARSFRSARGRSEPPRDVEAGAWIDGIRNALRQRDENSSSFATAFRCC